MQRALHYVKYWVKEGGESYALKEPANWSFIPLRCSGSFELLQTPDMEPAN
jgi:hypothetical protein